jgi:phosphate transport system permease protein
MSSVAATSTTRAAVERALRGHHRDASGAVFQAALLLSLVLSFLVLVTLLVDIVRTAWPILSERPVEFLTSPYSSIASRAGVSQALWGSAVLMLFVIVMAFPIGIAAAVYIEEYARDTRMTRFINANIRNLAGVPSIVYGILGIVIFVKLMSPLTGGGTVLAGGLTLATLVLPIVIITAAEGLRAVPWSLREAGYGVGATKWEVIRSHVLPNAAPGIFTGTVLSLARALGETAPLLLVGAIRGFFVNPGSFIEQLHGPYTSLPTLIYTWAKMPSLDFQANTAAAIVVLMVVLLLMNSVAIVLRNRYERRW